MKLYRLPSVVGGSDNQRKRRKVTIFLCIYMYTLSYVLIFSDEAKSIVHFKLRYIYILYHIAILPYCYSHMQSVGSGSNHTPASAFQSSYPG